MDTPLIGIQMTVEEVLQKRPQAFSVFMSNKTSCVGCYLQRFCTLKDVSELYRIPLEKLVEEIEHVSGEIQ